MRALMLLVGTAGFVVAGCGGGSTAKNDAAGAGATVAGTLTLPAAAPGKPYAVRIFTVAGAPGTPVGEVTGSTPAGTTLPYVIASVPAGTYFVLGFVDVDASGGT